MMTNKTGTLTKKIQCHPQYVVMMPPKARPLPEPMAANELKIPMAFARYRVSVKV